MSRQGTATTGLDLLDLRMVRALVRWPGFPVAFQVVALGFFLGLLILGSGQPAPDGVPAKLYAKSNLVTLLIWGIWWPVMIWVAVGFGRVWCAVCPLELVADRGERLGERLGIRRRNLSRWVRGGWLMLACYAVIQLLIAGVGLHRTPAYTSLFLIALLGSAAVVGVLFQHRAYCRGFCPVGLLLGTYGRGSMLAVRARHAHGDSDAAAVGQVARSCPSLLNPPKLDSSKDCLICGACVKASDHDEMAIVLRPPFDARDAREAMASWPVTLFVILVSGFVTYELTTNWPAGKAVFLWLPSRVAEGLGLDAGNGWIAGLWKLGLWPLLLWTLLGGATVVLGGAASLGEAWRRLALPIAVVVAAAHMAKGLEKLATWSGYLPGTLEEPLGVQVTRAYASGELAKPGTLLSMPVLSGIGLLLLAGAGWFALRELRLSHADRCARRRPAVIAVSALFGLMVLRWGLWA